MNVLTILHNVSHRVRCARKRRELIADLHALSDWQLQDIGIWRGAIPGAAAEILARQGCPLRHS